jgi:hypothetical protein
MFVGFDEKNGEALYDTKEAAIERAKQLRTWCGDPNDRILVSRKWAP